MTEDNRVVAVILLAVLALLGVVIFAGVADPIGDMGVADIDERIDDPQVSESYEYGGSLEDIDVVATRGYAAAFIGDSAERYIDVAIDEGWSDGDWSVLFAARLAPSANPDAAYTVFAHDNESIVIQYETGEWLAYTENALGEDATVTVDADQGDWENGSVTFDESANELNLTVGGVSNATTLDFADEDRILAADWRGNLDEIRVLNATATDADVSSYVADPVAPLPDSEGEHVARLMFNEGEGETVEVFYADTDAELVNVGWAAGLTDPGLVEGVDYDRENGAVTILDGYLDGAPVAFVIGESGLGGAYDAIVSGFGGAMALVPIVLIAMMAGVVLFVVSRIRRGV